MTKYHWLSAVFSAALLTLVVPRDVGNGIVRLYLISLAVLAGMYIGDFLDKAFNQ